MHSPDEEGMTEDIIHKYVVHAFAHDIFSTAENTVALHHVRQRQIQEVINAAPPGEDTGALRMELELWKKYEVGYQRLKETYENKVVESDKRLLPEDQGHQK
jgi:hypothetical protein